MEKLNIKGLQKAERDLQATFGKAYLAIDALPVDKAIKAKWLDSINKEYTNLRPSLANLSPVVDGPKAKAKKTAKLKAVPADKPAKPRKKKVIAEETAPL